MQKQRSQHAMTLCVICLLTVCAFLPTFWNGFQMEWDTSGWWSIP
ncbi:MAG: hypothetical protein ACI4B5_05995 [Bacteroidaceae bacterium]